MERITRENVERRLENLNARLASRHSVYRYDVQARNGHLCVDRMSGQQVVSLVTCGTKREIADALHFMMVALDDAANVEPEHVWRARELGAEHGKSAGSWVIDGNTDAETARRILQGYEDGDPAILDMTPAPLSGEWADSPTPRWLADEIGDENGELIEEACDVFEEAFIEAYWGEVVRSAQAIL